MPPSKPTIGKGNSLLYALFVSAFLVWQSVDISYDKEGLVARTKEVPLPTIVACSTFIAVGLGINILDTLVALQQVVYRNSQLINSIAKKQNIDTTNNTIIEAESTEEDSQNTDNQNG
jgi:hypothetical protein